MGSRTMRRGSIVVLATAALVVLALLAVFGFELADTQATSRRDIVVRVHQRTVLAGALINSAFESSLLQVPLDTRSYGGRVITRQMLNAVRDQSAYVVVLDRAQHVVANSSGFTRQARADLRISSALALLRAGAAYGLGNVLPYGRTGVINLAVRFPTAYGSRILLTGLHPAEVSPFLTGELKRIPEVQGARSYIVDAHLNVIASTDPGIPAGYRFTERRYVTALMHGSGDYDGYYFDVVRLRDSTWRILLALPNGPLFASVSGLRESVPWIIFALFAVMAATALLLGARILRSAEGRVTATEREAISERRRLERQIAQMQRLESLGQLAGGIAHDFNNLLAVILNYARFVSDEVRSVSSRDSEKWRGVAADVGEIERAARKASGLTRQLLAFARREVTHPEVLDLNAIVEETEQLLQRTLGEHIELRCSLADDLSAVMADPSQIEQVLINLAVNARDAMPDGGTLTLQTSNVDVDVSYASVRPELTPGRYVRLRVSDTGTGMDAETAEHAFEPFFTTKPEGEGTGLGLATVYGIVSQSGGRVSLYSVPGVGTTCTIMLPATEQRVSGRPLPTPDQAGGGGEVVLLVEDEDGIREVAKRILTRRGYRVLTAAGGAEAIELTRAYTGQIDLLMTDVIMPRMLGKEVAERILALRPGIRVMFMSGYAQPILDGNTNLPDGLILLEKPFTEHELLEKLREALGRAPTTV